MKLSRQQRKKLQDALIDAFPNKASLEQMVSLELDKNLVDYSAVTISQLYVIRPLLAV